MSAPVAMDTVPIMPAAPAPMVPSLPAVEAISGFTLPAAAPIPRIGLTISSTPLPTFSFSSEKELDMICICPANVWPSDSANPPTVEASAAIVF